MADSLHRKPPHGTRRLYWRIDPDMTDEEVEERAEQFVDAVLGARIEDT